MTIRPGERNLVGDMDVASKLVATERSLARAPLTAVVSSAAGSAAAGVLATLVELRTITSGYTPPPDRCASYEMLYARPEHLEADTHRHIHLARGSADMGRPRTG